MVFSYDGQNALKCLHPFFRGLLEPVRDDHARVDLAAVLGEDDVLRLRRGHRHLHEHTVSSLFFLFGMLKFKKGCGT